MTPLEPGGLQLNVYRKLICRAQYKHPEVWLRSTPCPISCGLNRSGNPVIANPMLTVCLNIAARPISLETVLCRGEGFNSLVRPLSRDSYQSNQCDLRI